MISPKRKSRKQASRRRAALCLEEKEQKQQEFQKMKNRAGGDRRDLSIYANEKNISLLCIVQVLTDHPRKESHSQETCSSICSRVLSLQR